VLVTRSPACYEIRVDPHRLAELRSIALHEAIGHELLLRPGLVDEARARIRSLHSDGKLATFYRDEWLAVLALPLERVVAFLSEDSDRARAMRQATPFAGVIGPRERWRIWRAVREVA
jgi:hypothetical protein